MRVPGRLPQKGRGRISEPASAQPPGPAVPREGEDGTQPRRGQDVCDLAARDNPSGK